MVGRCGEEASGQKNQNFGYYETEWLVKLWADKEIQQPLSVMSRKQNISCENIAAKLNDNGYKRTASHCKTNNSQPRSISV